MHDLSWSVFKQTGNIETYLLVKELDRLRKPTDPTLIKGYRSKGVKIDKY
ncbi:YqzL family protein [Halobacillus seohaensis]|uniref:YqzL family protein n=1 Tax=Halobacillus seohaensis TaxID=447421 RepID=A0ABW2EH78_9BACI